jgi:hypothetical protein
MSPNWQQEMRDLRNVSFFVPRQALDKPNEGIAWIWRHIGRERIAMATSQSIESDEQGKSTGAA